MPSLHSVPSGFLAISSSSGSISQSLCMPGSVRLRLARDASARASCTGKHGRVSAILSAMHS